MGADVGEPGASRGGVAISQQQLVEAMRHYEAAQEQPRDKVSLAPAVSVLAEVLGGMWFRREDVTTLSEDHPAVGLLQACGILDGAGTSGAT